MEGKLAAAQVVDPRETHGRDRAVFSATVALLCVFGPTLMEALNAWKVGATAQEILLDQLADSRAD